MKVLYYSPHPDLDNTKPSGYSTHINEVILALQNKNIEVKSLILGKKKPTQTKAKDYKKRKNNILRNSLSDLKLIIFDVFKARKKLKQAINEFQPDLVYERSNYLQFSGVKICRKKGLIHFLELNAPYTEQRKELKGQSLFYGFSKRVEKYKFHNSSKIFPVSAALGNFIVDNYNIDKERIVPSLMAVRNRPIFKEENNKNKKITIGYIGSVFPWNGIELLINMLNKKDFKEKFILKIIGGGSYLDYLLNKIVKPDNVEIINWLGQEEIKKHMTSFDLAILPNFNWYSSPTKILEYGLYEIPIIAANTPAIKELINNTDLGSLVTPLSEKEISEKLKRYLVNPIEFKQKSLNFKKHILRYHTWDNRASDIINEYAKINRHS